MVCRTAPFSMTLDDPKPRFQGQVIISGHYLTLNISEMAKDTAIVTMEGEFPISAEFQTGAQIPR